MPNELYAFVKKDRSDYDNTEWVTIGWTDNPRIAGLWKNSSHRFETRDFNRVPEMTAEELAMLGITGE